MTLSEDPARIVVGGDGVDTMYYVSPFDQNRLLCQSRRLDNDGYAGENDNAVENVVGGNGGDTLIGDDNDNVLSGQGEADNSIVGNGGMTRGPSMSASMATSDRGDVGGDGDDSMENFTLDGAPERCTEGRGMTRCSPPLTPRSSPATRATITSAI